MLYKEMRILPLHCGPVYLTDTKMSHLSKPSPQGSLNPDILIKRKHSKTRRMCLSHNAKFAICLIYDVYFLNLKPSFFDSHKNVQAFAIR